LNLKIGIIGTRGIPNNYGGFEQFAEYLSQGLTHKGYNVAVYNSHNHPYRKKTWEGVQIIKKFDPEFLIGLSGQFIYDLNCILDSRKRKFDLILQLGYTTNSVWHFFFKKKILRICNPDGMEWKRSKYPKPIKKFLKYAEKLAVNHNEALIADSRVIKSYYEKKYGKKTYFSAYPAKAFNAPNKLILSDYNIQPYQYNLLIARFQKDNHIEEIIKGTIHSSNTYPLLLIGNFNNKFGKYLKATYTDKRINFLGPIYNIDILNNLRYYSNIYFHGHSAGGTNPSLLEAMASSAFIIANDNPYNRDVLKENALYFKTPRDITELLNKKYDKIEFKKLIENNLTEIKQNYNHEKIIDEYHQIFTLEYINFTK
jgi:glycosyltransferase involved in cell wall biosynthesis